MSQVTAGKSVCFNIDGRLVKAKVEDGTKSESISAKVESSNNEAYKNGRVYDFDRNQLVDPGV